MLMIVLQIPQTMPPATVPRATRRNPIAVIGEPPFKIRVRRETSFAGNRTGGQKESQAV